MGEQYIHLQQHALRNATLSSMKQRWRQDPVGWQIHVYMSLEVFRGLNKSWLKQYMLKGVIKVVRRVEPGICQNLRLDPAT